ncbi:MAG: ATP-binding protein [Alphaproteobacteria bacterium]|nr:ATP-binding protein [Alphaproteobacteria bacterium]
MAKLFLICGFLGAGKTTVSKQLAKQYNAEYMNVDSHVTQLFARDEYEHNWEKCFSIAEDDLWQKIKLCAQSDTDVVFDVGFWTRKSRDMASARARQIGMTPIVYYVYAPDEILKKRIAQRSGRIAENNIKNFDTIKQMFENPQVDEDFVQVDNF